MDVKLSDSGEDAKWTCLQNWLYGPKCSIYLCHFLASWSTRMWGFAMGVFLITISPDSLQLSAIYGLVMGAAVLLLAALVGDWVDRTPRLRAALQSMILQNLAVIVCTCVLFVLLLMMSHDVVTSGAFYHLLVACIIALSVTSRLLKVARVLVIERDWIIEICVRNEHHLAVMTSSFRRIDLMTKMVAPVVIGYVLSFAGNHVGCVFIACWTIASIGAEYFLIHRVYKIVPELRHVKTLPAPHENQRAYEIEIKDGHSSHDKNDEPHQVMMQKQRVCETQHQKSVCSNNKPTEVLKKMLSSFTSLYKGFRTYFSYDVKWAGLALASLYMTALGFDSITIGYATTQGLGQHILGVLMGVGAAFGILATFTYPFIVKCLGLPKTGVFALGLQVSCLAMCMVSIWLPGSPFDLRNRSSSSVSTNITHQTGFLDAVYTTESFDHPMTTQSSSDSTVSVETAEPTFSIWLMMAGIVTARFGLWTADLAITQLFLESVQPDERGIVNGFQSSLNKLMDFLKFAVVMVLPHPRQFGLLVIISFSFICLGWALMSVYAFKTASALRAATEQKQKHLELKIKTDFVARSAL